MTPLSHTPVGLSPKHQPSLGGEKLTLCLLKILLLYLSHECPAAKDFVLQTRSEVLNPLSPIAKNAWEPSLKMKNFTRHEFVFSVGYKPVNSTFIECQSLWGGNSALAASVDFTFLFFPNTCIAFLMPENSDGVMEADRWRQRLLCLYLPLPPNSNWSFLTNYFRPMRNEILRFPKGKGLSSHWHIEPCFFPPKRRYFASGG